MNILFLLHSYPKVGGIEMVTQTISRYLKKKHKLYYLATVSEFQATDSLSDCFYFPSKNKKTAVEYYNHLIAKLEIDAVINQGPYLPYSPIIFNSNRNSNVKVFSFLHFMPGFEFERIKYAWMTKKKTFRRFYKQVRTKLRLNSLQYNPGKTRKKYRELYHMSDRMVVLSPEYVQLFQKAYHLAECSKLTVISNPSRYACTVSNILDRKKKVVLFMGRLELESKRVDRLLLIWKSILHKEGWILKIVGDGPHREQLERMVADENIENVLFTGSRNSLETFYEEAAVIALTSTYEGLPLCFIEGIQFGAVPLSFCVSAGIKEILEDISPDILIEPFATDRYAECLSELICNDARRNETALKALKKSVEYRLENIGQQWDKLIEC